MCSCKIFGNALNSVTSGNFSRAAPTHLVIVAVMTADLRDVELLLRSRHAVVFLETSELGRAESSLFQLAERMSLPFSTWTPSKGLRRSFEKHLAQDTLPAAAALAQVERLHQKGVYNFQGLGRELHNPALAAKLADAARQFLTHEGGVVISGDLPDEVPAVLRPFVNVVEFPLPTTADLQELVRRLYRDLSGRAPVEYRLTPEELAQLVRNLEGLTMFEAEKILTKAVIEDAQLGPDDLKRVIADKQRILGREGLLEYYPAATDPVPVAGAENLLTWLHKRRLIIDEPERARAFGLEFPKGLLLVGVQGTGKSLSARAVAASWGLPLIKLDPSSLYNKYVGETEKNFRRATRTAEKMAPVVLWIDEIEKAFASAGDVDGGVSQRMLGLFLSWLQERRGDVFVVATANDVAKLPPEMIRKGRFDEIFFLDLPDAGARRGILKIHLERRKRDPKRFDLGAVAAASTGFSGAELEQVVVSTLYTAFAGGGDVTTELLLDEVQQTVPLAVSMRERIGTLRRWAEGRTVAAARSVPANG